MATLVAASRALPHTAKGTGQVRPLRAVRLFSQFLMRRPQKALSHPAREVEAGMFCTRFPDPAQVLTSSVEPLNLDVRRCCRPFTRLTNAFSRKLANRKAVVAVFAAVHNFVKMHRSLRMTPAMKADLTRRPWRVADLLSA